MSTSENAALGDDALHASPPPHAEPPHPRPVDRLPPATSEARAAREQRQARQRDFWALMGCNAIVFSASVCVMVLELTASRLVAAHLGNSLYTWTSVIGVVLAGISLGNYLGGHLAERFRPGSLLGWLFVASGVLTFSVLWLNQWMAVGHQPDWIEWRWWVMLVIAIIFLLPALSLGTISPVVASMALARGRRVGVTVGNVYAWGAVGSIVGTFLAGFYLIDRFGTRGIVQITSSALIIIGVIVAGGQRAFRVAALLGLLQFVTIFGLCATLDAESAAWGAGKVGRLWSAFTGKSRTAGELKWANWGRGLGRHVHEVGRGLGLRGDDPDEYNDESQYYAINISTRNEGGHLIKELRLDHLLHSYYVPDDPNKLEYDYERVYAELTERAAAQWPRATEVELSQAPLPLDDFRSALPPGIEYDDSRHVLVARGAVAEDATRSLLRLGSEGAFRTALWELLAESRRAKGGMATSALSELPNGVQLSAEPAAGDPLPDPRIYYDTVLNALVSYGTVTPGNIWTLMAQGTEADYVRAVQKLHETSRQIGALFIGGGGFIFPRWIESQFPFQPRIDVAEIDPAVKLAVQREMGLAADGPQNPIHIFIEDARKLVQDLNRENRRAAEAGRPLALYDFIYGDAFNDFSVPWHLTTREFTTQVRQLLHPDTGVFLVNIIDIYPRAEYPSKENKAGQAEINYRGPLPQSLLPEHMPEGEWVRAAGAFSDLEISREISQRVYRIRYRKPMHRRVSDQLQQLFSHRDEFDLVEPLPRELDPGSAPASSDGWRRAPHPHELLEVHAVPGLKVGVTKTKVRYHGPWHEATELRRLLPAVDDILDEYDRAIDQLFLDTNARQMYRSPLPPAWQALQLPESEWVAAPAPHQSMFFKNKGARGLLLGYRGVMSDDAAHALGTLAPRDGEFQSAIRSLQRQSRQERAGAFLGRYVATARAVFPHVYVYSGNEGLPGDTRDTFVVACSNCRLDLRRSLDGGRGAGSWSAAPFAASEPDGQGGIADTGEMSQLLELSRGLQLTDDYAPVDNLLVPVFARQ